MTVWTGISPYFFIILVDQTVTTSCKLIAFLLILTAFKVVDVMLIAFDNLHTNDLLPKLDF